jgi:hypothetical protein
MTPSWRESHDGIEDHRVDLYHVTYDEDPRRWEHCRKCDRVGSDVRIVNVTKTALGELVRTVVA